MPYVFESPRQTTRRFPEEPGSGIGPARPLNAATSCRCASSSTSPTTTPPMTRRSRSNIVLAHMPDRLSWHLYCLAPMDDKTTESGPPLLEDRPEAPCGAQGRDQASR